MVFSQYSIHVNVNIHREIVKQCRATQTPKGHHKRVSLQTDFQKHLSKNPIFCMNSVGFISCIFWLRVRILHAFAYRVLTFPPPLLPTLVVLVNPTKSCLSQPIKTISANTSAPWAHGFCPLNTFAHTLSPNVQYTQTLKVPASQFNIRFR